MNAPGRRRILMTTDAVGGVWVYATTLARALCAGGDEVMLATMGPAPRPQQLEPLFGIGGLHVKITDLNLEWLDPSAVDMARASIILPAMAEEFHPDIIHLNSFREAVFDWPAPVLVVAHSCVHTWWRACRRAAPTELRWARYAEHVAAGLSAADAWVAPTAAFRDAISAAYRPRMPGCVINNGVSVAAGQQAKEPLIMAAGRLWDEAKNVVALTRVAAALPWPVQVAGPIQAPDGSAAAAAAGVTTLGELPHPALLDALRRASIFVAPALYEPFGLTVLEAAACGCALILSDLPTFRELWTDAAIFVDPRNSDALAATIGLLCRDELLRPRLQQAAAARARTYSTGRMTEACRNLYAEIVGVSARTPTCGSSVLELPA